MADNMIRLGRESSRGLAVVTSVFVVLVVGVVAGLASQTTISGRVVELVSQEGIPDARIVMTSTESLRMRFAISSEDGNFLLKEPPTGLVELVAFVYGYAPEVKRFYLNPGERRNHLRFQLKRSGTVAGQVVTSARDRVTAAFVEVDYLAPLPARAAPRLESATFSHDGDFLLENVHPERPFRVVVTHPTFGEGRSHVIVLSPDQELSGIVIEISTGA